MEKKIFEFLIKHLSPKRFEHSYNVSKLAVELARIYGVDILKAQTAALLHDCAKYQKTSALISSLKKRRKTIKNFNDIKKHYPHVLHSFAGELIAEKKFKIKDKSVLKAVRNHTLGEKNMSMLEKILFVADAVSIDRKHRGGAKIRKLAKTDIDAALKAVMIKKIEYVLKSGGLLCPKTLEVWNYYASKK